MKKQSYEVKKMNQFSNQKTDDVTKMEAEAKWIASAVGRHIPLHVTRFFPRYQMNDRAATEVAKVNRLADIARRHLAYVWTGNC